MKLNDLIPELTAFNKVELNPEIMWLEDDGEQSVITRVDYDPVDNVIIFSNLVLVEVTDSDEEDDKSNTKIVIPDFNS